jgi:hypothetical protein
MTAVADEHEEGMPFGPVLLRPPARAHARASAMDLEPGEVLPQVPSLPPRTERARVRAAQVIGGTTAVLEKPGTLMHAQPPTFRQAQLRHHECAGHYAHPLARAPRVAYGYGHMLCIKAPLNYVEWATDSPLRGTIHALLGLAVWLGLLLGGYL